MVAVAVAPVAALVADPGVDLHVGEATLLTAEKRKMIVEIVDGGIQKMGIKMDVAETEVALPMEGLVIVLHPEGRNLHHQEIMVEILLQWSVVVIQEDAPQALEDAHQAPEDALWLPEVVLLAPEADLPVPGEDMNPRRKGMKVLHLIVTVAIPGHHHPSHVIERGKGLVIE